MEIKLIIFILTAATIHSTVSLESDEKPNNATNLPEIELNTYEVNENETIRTKRHPAILVKTRPIRLKRLPITTVYRRHPPGPPPHKYGAPPPSHQTSHNLAPPKPRYGPKKHKPGIPIVDYKPTNIELSDSYGQAYDSDLSSHNDFLSNYQETHLVDTNAFDSYESYKTPVHFSSDSQSSYEYYPSHQPSIPISNSYNSESSGVVSSSGGSKLKFPSFHPETYNENIDSDSYSGTFYSIPSTSYGVPSNTYGDGANVHQQHQQQEHQYDSYAPQYQSQPQGTYNYQPASQHNPASAPAYQPPPQQNPAPAHQNTYSAVSYSPPAPTYNNYQPAQQTPISYKPPQPIQQQNNQPSSYNFAEPPTNNQHFVAPQPNSPPQQPNPSYSNSVSSYNPPANFPKQHQPSTKLQGAYNTPVPVYTTKKRHSQRATTKQTSNDNIISVSTEKYDFQLDESDNSGSLYDTSISSYDVPLHYNFGKDQKYQKSYPPNENFEPSKPKKSQPPPMLPTIYDQEEFSSFRKTKNESPKIRQPEFQDFAQFFDAAVYKPHPTQKPKKRTKYSASQRPPITNLNAFASYEDILSTTEQYYDEPSTIQSTTTTTNPRFRRKKITKPPPPYLSNSNTHKMNNHNLDTDDLRDAYGSSSHIHSSVIRTDAIAKFESMKNKNRLPPTMASETKSKSIGITGPTKYHSNYTTPTKDSTKYDVVSIEKSKSHSYYAGTMAPSLAANFATRRQYDVATGDKHSNKYGNHEDESSNNKAFNVFSSGFYVSDGSATDVSGSSEGDFNSDYYDNEDDIENAYATNSRKPTWNGGSLPKNHKLTSKDISSGVHS